MTRKHHRGQFFQTAARASTFAFPLVIPASALGCAGRLAPGDRIVIGVGGMGPADLNALMTNPDVAKYSATPTQNSIVPVRYVARG